MQLSTFRMVVIGNIARASPIFKMHSSLVSMFSMLMSASNLLNEHLSDPMCKKRNSKVIGAAGRVFDNAIFTLRIVSANVANKFQTNEMVGFWIGKYSNGLRLEFSTL